MQYDSTDIIQDIVGNMGLIHKLLLFSKKISKVNSIGNSTKG